jgi:hypothetical protein
VGGLKTKAFIELVRLRSRCIGGELHPVRTAFFCSAQNFCHQLAANAMASQVASHMDGFNLSAKPTTVLKVTEVEQLRHGHHLIANNGDDHFPISCAGEFFNG